MLRLNDQTLKELRGNFCGQAIQSYSWFYGHYDFYEVELHKFCGELPMEMEHPLHLKHPLELSYRSNYSICAVCKVEKYGHMYGCEACHFYIDAFCATFGNPKKPKEQEVVVLKDQMIIHHHQLKLLHVRIPHPDDHDSDDDDDDGECSSNSITTIEQMCKACGQQIAESSFYKCMEEDKGCKDFSLHKFCAELPTKMKHALHPLHSLVLTIFPLSDDIKCFACRELCQGYSYWCQMCSFQLHITCATTASRVLEHKCHEHPLTLLPMPNSALFCSACAKVHDEGMFYQCTTCVVFFIHKHCASLAYEINHRSHQGHFLHLRYHSDGSERAICDICYEAIHDITGWFYHCWECKFYGHLNCILSDKDQEVMEIDPNIPCLPWEEPDNEFGTVGLLNRTLRDIHNHENNGINMVTINHFSHEYPLVLQSDGIPKEANPYSDGEITPTTQCNGCCKMISAPLYGCTGCPFYIHKCCALLPSSIAQHHAHSEHENRRLLLVREPWYETRIFACDDCGESCNGFAYKCEDESCNYKIDVECAFLPKKIVHKAHPFHPLTLVNLEEHPWPLKGFKCCQRYGSWVNDYWFKRTNYGYVCYHCSFKIHAKCAMLPSKVNHRYDSDYPFKLTFTPGEVKPNEHYHCDICEDTLHPKVWFYYSSSWGGQLIHPHCISVRCDSLERYPNFKSTSSVFEVDIHPHSLHLLPSEKFIQGICSLCEHPLRWYSYYDHKISFICLEPGCKFTIHTTCFDIRRPYSSNRYQRLQTGNSSPALDYTFSSTSYVQNAITAVEEIAAAEDI